MPTTTMRNSGRRVLRSLSHCLPHGLMACAALWAASAGWPSPAAADGFDPKKADFTVAYNTEVSPFRDAAAFVLPGETMTLQVTDGPAGESSFNWRYPGAPTSTTPCRRSRWSASMPAASVETRSVRSSSTREAFAHASSNSGTCATLSLPANLTT